MSSVTVQVRGVTEIQRVLKKWMDPELSKELDAAAKKSALLYARELRSAVKPLSRRMARAVRVHRARREKPAWVVGSRRKTAFFWPFVIGGTREHGARKASGLVWRDKNGRIHRAQRVRGVSAHPVVEEVATRAESRAMAEADNYLGKNT